MDISEEKMEKISSLSFIVSQINSISGIFNDKSMAPKGSFPELKYPSLRDTHINRSAELWLEGKRLDDNAEGLWRVHNKLYDLSDFMDKHPGGRQWLELSKGTDITEAFEAHHITDSAVKVLPKYYTREANGPRNSPYTFNDDGFYRTLKRNVAPVLKSKQKNGGKHNSALILDLLMLGIFIFGTLAARYESYMCGVLSGMCLAMCTVAAHNFFHQRDNFRMYYFDLSFMSSKEWRISHVLSHHLYTNTLQDFEISMVEPFFQYLPTQKSGFVRYMPMIYSFIIYAVIFQHTFLIRIIRIITGKCKIEWPHFLPFTVPLVMYILSGTSLMNVLYWWLFLITVGSLHFFLVGFNAAHHHPNIFHDGDAPREDRDWGLWQLDAVMDRYDINGNSFLVLTNFGEHILHHLFPTVDHSTLPELLPIVKETCEQFGVELRLKSQLELFVGQFRQLARVKPMEVPLSYYDKKKK